MSWKIGALILTGIKKIETKACCGKTQIILQFEFPLEQEHIQFFLLSNFLESKSYTSRGILYMEDPNLSIMGPFGSNRLTLKCKNKDCNNSIVIIEKILKNIKTFNDAGAKSKTNS